MGGVAPLVAVLGLGSARAQEQAAGALAALALDNPTNEKSIATMLVSLLGSSDRRASAKAARAISHLARANAANQVAISAAGGVKLLVSLLDDSSAEQSRTASREEEGVAGSPATTAPAPAAGAGGGGGSGTPLSTGGGGKAAAPKPKSEPKTPKPDEKAKRRKKIKPAQEAELRQAFEMADADGGGTIDREELREVRGRGRRQGTAIP